MWQVLIVEDDRRTREFFSASVRQRPELALVDAVGTVKEALDWLGEPSRRVDVLLIDLGLPDGNGLEVIRAAVKSHPECDPLVVSMFGDDESVLASIEAGALGYIHKDATPDDITRTILDMKAGASPISPMIARRVLSRVRAMQHHDDSPASVREAHAGAADPVVLSDREREVLNLISRGFSYADVARLNCVTLDTVRSHIRNLYRKLAVHSRGEAVFEASRMGLL